MLNYEIFYSLIRMLSSTIINFSLFQLKFALTKLCSDLFATAYVKLNRIHFGPRKNNVFFY